VSRDSIHTYISLSRLQAFTAAVFYDVQGKPLVGSPWKAEGSIRNSMSFAGVTSYGCAQGDHATLVRLGVARMRFGENGGQFIIGEPVTFNREGHAIALYSDFLSDMFQIWVVGQVEEVPQQDGLGLVMVNPFMIANLAKIEWKGNAGGN